MREEDELHMGRAIDLARASGFTSPNPKVGAVVVRDGLVIGEGRHRGPGTPHAEIAALAGVDSSGATLYVNLEPCIHLGLTPPCAPALVGAGIARVVAAVEDPDERVRGRGVAHLRAHGVEVETGVLAADAARVNAPYLHHRRTGRPLVTLKLAMSLDGRLGARDGSARWITGTEARRRVHAARAGADAVIVGAGTVAADDPLLTARDPRASRQPVRVVVDSSGQTPATAAVLGREAETIIATTPAASHEAQTAWKEAGAEVVVLPETTSGVDLGALLDHAGARGWLEVYCEGGARLATSLLRTDLVDRLEIHYGPKLVGAGGPELGDLGVPAMAEAIDWDLVEAGRAGPDTVVVLERGRG